MIGMYFRVFIAILVVFLMYAGGIYYFPAAGNKIDTTLGIEMNKNLSLKIDNLLQKSKQAGDAFNNKLDNPAPNTVKRIEGRSTSQ